MIMVFFLLRIGVLKIFIYIWHIQIKAGFFLTCMEFETYNHFRKSADTISGAAVASNIDATGFQPTKMLCVRI